MGDTSKRRVVFGRRDTGEEKEATVGLAQFTAAAVPGKRKVVKALDLSGTPAAWLLIGQGRAGKTTFARWVGGRAEQAGRELSLAALDPTNRSLALFLNGVRDRRIPGGYSSAGADLPSASMKERPWQGGFDARTANARRRTAGIRRFLQSHAR